MFTIQIPLSCLPKHDPKSFSSKPTNSYYGKEKKKRKKKQL